MNRAQHLRSVWNIAIAMAVLFSCSSPPRPAASSPSAFSDAEALLPQDTLKPSTGALVEQDAWLTLQQTPSRKEKALVAGLAPSFAGGQRAVSADGVTLTLLPLRAQHATALPQGTRVAYLDAWPSTDALYAPSHRRLKEVLLLRSDAAPRQFEWRVLLSGPAVLFADDSGAVQARLPNGDAALELERPWAVDASGKKVDLAWTLHGDTVSVTLPDGLSYPVALDPTVGVPSWTNRTTSATQPPPRKGAALVYLSSTGRFLLFGGSGAPGFLNDTWEYNPGTETWTQYTPTGAPAARDLAGLVYDSFTNKAILFGGNGASGALADTFAYTPSTHSWQQLTPSASPPGRAALAMAYDSGRHEVVLFGGRNGTTFYGDTWYFNGTTWSSPATGASATPRAGAAAAYDPLNEEVAIFGGVTTTGAYLSETLQWSGATRTLTAVVPDEPPPPARAFASMAWSESESALVMGFGELDVSGATTHDLWSWDGMAWTEITAMDRSPANRAQTAMASNGAAGEVFVFGGSNLKMPGGFGDLWKLPPGGYSWTDLSPAYSPTARAGAKLAYDEMTGVAILYGGSSGGGQTWEWDSLAGVWMNVTPGDPGEPVPASSSHAMAFDPNLGAVVLMVDPSELYAWDAFSREWLDLTPVSATLPPSGATAALTYDAVDQKLLLFTATAETWLYDTSARTWTNVTPAGSKPSPRTGAALTYLTVQGKALLFGGNASGTAQDDQWLWDSASHTWSQVSVSPRPSARYGHVMVYDPARQVVVLHGGANGTPNGETWEWNGTAWTQRSPSTAPSARFDHAGTWDSFAGRLVIHGGAPGPSADTWEYQMSNPPPAINAPVSRTVAEGATTSFTVYASDPDASDVVTLTSPNLPAGATFSPPVANPTSGKLTWTPNFTQAGTYVVTFEASDGWNTVRAFTTITVTNVNRPPVLTSPGNKTVSEGELLSFTLSATDPDAEPLTYSATGLPTGATLTGADFTWTPDFTQSGTYPVTFTVTDPYGAHSSQSITITVVNANNLPVLTVPGAQTVAEGAPLTFGISATDPDNEVVTLSLLTPPAGATLTTSPSVNPTGTFQWTPGFTQAGAYTLTFQAQDAVGGIVTATVAVTVTNTNRAPTLAPIGNKTVAENALVTFTLGGADPDGDALVYSSSALPPGATLAGAVFSWTPDFTQAGAYPITFTVSDGTLSASEPITLTVTNTNRAPLLTPIGNKTVAENALLTFTLVATDPDGDEVTYSSSALPAGATLSGAVFSWTPDFTQAGTSSITFTVSDGTLSASETIQVTVLNTNRAPVLLPPGDQAVAENALLTFALSASDLDGDALTYSATGLPTGASLAGAVFSWTPDFTQAGAYTVTFTASDGTLSQSQVVHITVTNVNRAPLMASPGDKSVNENALLAFTVTATDPDGDAVTLSATGLPNGATFTGGVFTWTPGYDKAGVYPVTFNATDGTLTTSVTISITVVNVNRAPLVTSPGDRTVAENALLTFILTGSDPDGDALTWSATGLPMGSTLVGAAFSWTPSFTQAGVYPITFTASDGSLSTSVSINVTVTNVNRAPILTPPGNQTVAENALLTFALLASDPDGDALTYSATGLPTGAVLTGASFSWTPTYDQAGVYTVTFTASDGTLSDSETVTLTVTNVNRAPVLAAIGAKTVNENALLAFTLSATDPDSDALTYSATGLPTGAVLTGAAFSWTPTYDQSGVYTVTFTVTDGTLSDSEIVTVTVTNVNRAPVLASIGNKTVNENALLTFTLSATDPDGTAVTYSATGLPTGATLSGAVFSWTPSFTQAGAYTVTFTASDGTLSDSETVTLTVVNVNRAPVLTSPGNRTVAEAALLSFTLSATDPDGDAVTYAATNLPTGATLTGASFSWTPGYDQAGTYTVTFTASDGTLSDSKTVTLTVTNVNRAPVLAPIGNRTIAENVTLTITLQGQDPDGDALTYSAQGLPAGATLTGPVLTWTPTFSDSGPHEVTFTVTDGTLSDSETITINVSNTNRAPVLTSPGNKTVAENQLLEFTLSAADPDGDGVSYLVNPLPAGATLFGADFTWTPDFTQAGTYTLTFTATDGSLSDAKTITLTVTNVNRLPVFALEDQTVNEGETLAFTVTATDPDGDALMYAATALPPGAAFDNQTGAFSWTPGFDQAGDYSATFAVSDGIDGATQTITVHVVNVNRRPVIETQGPFTVAEGAPFSLHLAGADPDGDAVTWTVEGLPEGASFDETTTTIAWTPSFTQAGDYKVTVRLSDGASEAAQELAITVTNTNHAPTLTGAQDHTFKVGETVEFYLATSDEDGEQVALSAAGLPEGATFVAAQGLFRWTPMGGDEGAHTVTFRASDGLTTTELKVLLTVNPADTGKIEPEGCGCQADAAGAQPLLFALMGAVLMLRARRRS